MDWNAAVEKNRVALKRILAMLVDMAGLAGFTSPLHPELVEGAGEDGSARRGKAEALAEPGEGFSRSRHPMLPRHLHRAVLRLLRPAEAAARRLIIVAARGLVLPPASPRKPNGGPMTLRKAGRIIPAQSENLVPRTPPLPLLDPLPRWGGCSRPAASGVPRISVPGFSRPFPIRLPSPDDPVDAARLASRLEALASALDDLPGQARRFARWRIRRDAAGAQNKEGRDAAVALDRNSGAAVAQDPKGRRKGRARRLWPLRPGRPPGSRQKPVHEVHELLTVVHGLAFWALESPDTS